MRSPVKRFAFSLLCLAVLAVPAGATTLRNKGFNALSNPTNETFRNTFVTELGTVDLSLTQAGGTAAGTGVTKVERGTAALQKTVLTFVNTPIVMIDNAGVDAHGGLKVYDFPAGAIIWFGATSDLALTKSSAGINTDWDGDVGLGTVEVAAGATLATTEQDLIPTTATPQAVAGVSSADTESTSTESANVFDGTSTAKDAFLNFLIDDADHDIGATPGNIIVNGSITLLWASLGDN